MIWGYPYFWTHPYRTNCAKNDVFTSHHRAPHRDTFVLVFETSQMSTTTTTTTTNSQTNMEKTKTHLRSLFATYVMFVLLVFKKQSTFLQLTSGGPPDPKETLIANTNLMVCVDNISQKPWLERRIPPFSA